MTENLTALESLGESLTEKKGRLETEFRRLTGARLVATIKAPGSLLSPDLAASLLGLSGRQVRRWMDSTTGLWIPKYSHCKAILNFAELVEEFREFWPKAIPTWKDAFRILPSAIRMTILPPGVLKTLEDPELSDAERAEELTILSLRLLRRTLEIENEIRSESTEADHVQTS
jgi:hypothetical protein